MQKRYGLGLMLLLGVYLQALHATEDVHYIADTLSVYLHGGPGEQYRIIGSLKTGDPVTILEVNQQKEFAHIQDKKGRTAWVSLQHLTQQPSLKVRLPLLEQQIAQMKSQLNTINADWQARTAALQQKTVAGDQQNQALQQENRALTQQAAELQQHLQGLQQQRDQQQRQELLQWFSYGGAVAGGGMLLGSILPALASRRRRRERWMS
jgi:SH3 domain protein